MLEKLGAFILNWILGKALGYIKKEIDINKSKSKIGIQRDRLDAAVAPAKERIAEGKPVTQKQAKEIIDAARELNSNFYKY